MHDWNILHPAQLQEEFVKNEIDFRTRVNKLEVLLIEQSRQINELKRLVNKLIRQQDESNKS